MKAKDIFQLFQGYTITIGIFVLVIYLIHDGGYKQEVSLLLGAIIGSFLTSVNWNFSSTKGSAEKTEMLYNSTKLPDQSKTETTSQTTSETDIKPPTS